MIGAGTGFSPTPSIGFAAQAVTNARALLVSPIFTGADVGRRIGDEAYSYYFVYRAFAPLLQRWGQVAEVTSPESRLDLAIRNARRDSRSPVHLSFLPLHCMYLTPHAPNIAFPFWEFPDIPNYDLCDNPRQNWVRLAARLDAILTASISTGEAFRRAGVTTPIHVVPVPIRPDYFDVADWKAQPRVLECPAYILPHQGPEQPALSPWAHAPTPRFDWRVGVQQFYRQYVRPFLPAAAYKCIAWSKKTVADARKALQSLRDDFSIPYPARPALELSGVVYTSIFNPFDHRKNWRDLISAYLLALGDRADATLVLKLVVPPAIAARELNRVLSYYRSLGLQHCCRLAVVSAYLSDEQMVQLAGASTYYVNASLAEGACLPLQDFMAAGRPGIAPDHTAMADYFHNELGFVVVSHPEPAAWPHDPEQRCRTRRYRIVWQSLYDHFLTSYDVAKNQPQRYELLASRSREQMRKFASAEAVRPRLEAALNEVLAKPSASSASTDRRWRMAS